MADAQDRMSGTAAFLDGAQRAVDDALNKAAASSSDMPFTPSEEARIAEIAGLVIAELERDDADRRASNVDTAAAWVAARLKQGTRLEEEVRAAGAVFRELRR